MRRVLTNSVKVIGSSNKAEGGGEIQPKKLPAQPQGDQAGGATSERQHEKHTETQTYNKEEITEIVISINDYLKNPPTDLKFVPPKPYTIDRVRINLREAHKDAFDPKCVSIGPLHRDKPNLKAMEAHKLRFLTKLLGSESTDHDHQQNEPLFDTTTTDDESLEKLVIAMKEMEVKARGCYSSETLDNFGSSEFIQMMILDGCFVVELMRLFAISDVEHVDDPIFSTRWMVPNLQHDLLLLENQLPFIVLKKIYEITRSHKIKKDNNCLEEVALKFFNPLMQCQKMKGCSLISDETVPYHLLGLFHSSFLKFDIRRNDTKTTSPVKQSKLINYVRQLKETGIKFKKTKSLVKQKDERKLINCVRQLKETGIKFKKTEERDLLDIEFKNGILTIAPLHIDDRTGSVFLNFLAYEQCNRDLKPYFTHYLLFFDRLVNSSKDVEILHYKGIIDHSLGSDEEVADLFNKLCKEVVDDVHDCYISKELSAIDQHSRETWHRWKAQLRHKYFSNPWVFLPLLAAIYLLFLSTMQTIFSIFPRSK
ncbi:Protein of unknown function DUF247 [Macleaya cordata]|uniref:Uncharacterized protein n=1 Tax=Macleaya cordata TaxID=56857 RepID=A0A200QPF4_MACCD|nr:Protein of unknown function DUF247 [Macleaya cordata]